MCVFVTGAKRLYKSSDRGTRLSTSLVHDDPRCSAGLSQRQARDPPRQPEQPSISHAGVVVGFKMHVFPPSGKDCVSGRRKEREGEWQRKRERKGSVS